VAGYTLRWFTCWHPGINWPGTE